MPNYETSQFELIGLAGEYAGQRIPLGAKPIVIGKDPKQASLILSSTQVSRQHCQISVMNGGVYVRDFGSTNGTWLNDERIQASAPTKIQPGDSVSIAGCEVFKVIAAQPTFDRAEAATVVPAYAPPQPQQPQPIINVQINMPQPTEYTEYAGFWRRVGAVLVDGLLISLVGYGIGLLLTIGITALIASLGPNEDVAFGAAFTGFIGWFIAFAFGPMLYFAFMESSAKQATYGKVAMGLFVTDLQGYRISFWRALGRNVGKFLSALILYFGFLMAAFTEKKQTLHDMMAGCLVVRGKITR